jgi:hypothetical protein
LRGAVQPECGQQLQPGQTWRHGSFGFVSVLNEIKAGFKIAGQNSELPNAAAAWRHCVVSKIQ